MQTMSAEQKNAAKTLRMAAFEQIGLQMPQERADRLVTQNIKLANRLTSRPTRWTMQQHVIPAIISDLGEEKIAAARNCRADQLLDILNDAFKQSSYTVRPGSEATVAHQLLNTRPKSMIPRTTALWLIIGSVIIGHKVWALAAGGIMTTTATIFGSTIGADGGWSPVIRAAAILCGLLLSERIYSSREAQICESYQRAAGGDPVGRHIGRALTVCGCIGAAFYENVIATEIIANSRTLQTLFLAAIITAITYGTGRIMASYDLADVA